MSPFYQWQKYYFIFALRAAASPVRSFEDGNGMLHSVVYCSCQEVQAAAATSTFAAATQLLGRASPSWLFHCIASSVVVKTKREKAAYRCDNTNYS